jgi:hypothetical protein
MVPESDDPIIAARGMLKGSGILKAYLKEKRLEKRRGLPNGKPLYYLWSNKIALRFYFSFEFITRCPALPWREIQI